MKKVFVKDIKEKDHVAESFLVTKKDMGVSKSGKPYIILRLMDSTGELEARAWENADALKELFEVDTVCRVKGYAVSYQGACQINVTDIRSLPEGDYSIREYLPASKREPAEMMKELEAVLASIEDVNIKALFKAIFADPDVKERFMLAPAAKMMHHSYLGGLLEHVLSMCGLADKVAAHYKGVVDRDLLIAGAILHDIGKIYELEYMRSFGYTDEGKLIGHITMGVELVDEKIRGLAAFPPELAMHVKHLMLSHHRLLEFGSPKRPKTIEAVVLCYLDDLDAKVNAISTLIAVDDGQRWSPYQRMFERPIFKGAPEKTLEDGGPAGDEEERTEKDAKAEDDPLTLFK